MADRGNNKKASAGAPIAPASDEDTGRLVAAVHGQAVLAVGQAEPKEATADAEKFLDALDKLIEKRAQANGGGGSSGSNGGSGSSRGFWGWQIGGVAKMLLAWLMAAVVALGAWHLTVRDELRERPTAPQMEQSVKATFDHHNDSSAAHPPIQHRLDDLSKTQTAIRESQVRQEETDKVQTQTLELIRVDISRMRRQHGN